MRNCLVAITLLFACINTSFALNGLGTEASPWLIQSLADFDEFTANSTYWSGRTRLDTNINLTDRTYTAAPIAPNGSPCFTGTFNGNSHIISNLTISTISGGAFNLGLFGRIAGGSVTNLALENIDISSTNTVYYSYYIGGLCGYNDYGTITQCYATNLAIVGTCYYIGGLCGYNGYGTITQCYATGSAIDTGECVGGICGYNKVGTITNCYFTDSVDGDFYVGGLCGVNGCGSVISCYSIGSITSTGSGTGGLCGASYGTITNSYSTGTVIGDDYVGGLCGDKGGSIANCYSTVAVTGDNYVGGFCGDDGAGTIVSCYSTGAVIGTGNYVGGLCGDSDYDSIIIVCYFLDTSGPNNGLGTPLTDAQLKQQSSFVGWDFIDEAANGIHDFWMITTGQYPSLRYFDPAFTPYPFGGSGTETDPYHITTIYGLAAVWQYPSADYILDNSIDTDGTTFNTAVIPSFSGTFDGNSHTICNLTISNGTCYLGLFGHINDGSVANLGMENINISGTGSYIGGLCGMNTKGGITNCYSTGSVTGTGDSVGGLCGDNSGYIVDCNSISIVTGGDTVGGLCGTNDGGWVKCRYRRIVNPFVASTIVIPQVLLPVPVVSAASVDGLVGMIVLPVAISLTLPDQIMVGVIP